MKKFLRASFFSAILLLAGAEVMAQCTISGLKPTYCISEQPDTLQVTNLVGGGNINQWGGPGLSDSIFDPGVAGVGTHVVSFTEGYQLDQTGTFNPIAAPAVTNQITMGDDDFQSGFAIGFTFNFFGSDYTTFGISSNGFMSFDAGSPNGCCNGQNLPAAAAPNNLIAFSWEDLDPGNFNGAIIEYWTQGTAPNQILVMQFVGVDHFPLGDQVTSQVQLHEGTNCIEIHTTTQPALTGSHTMGIEGPNGAAAVTVPGRNSQVWQATNDFVSFCPQGCADTTTITSAPTALLDITEPLCFGDQNATVEVNPFGGAMPYTIVWNDNSSDTIVTGGAGVYQVTVTDVNACTGTALGIVNQPLELTASISKTDVTCGGDTDGSASVMPSGGVPPYSVAWNDPNNQTGMNALNLGEGPVTATITDSNGCVAQETITLTFTSPDPNPDLGADTIVCDGQSTVLTPSGGAFFNFLWDDNSTDPTRTVTAAGTYTVTVTDLLGCQGTDDVVVASVSPDPFDIDDIFRIGPPVTITTGAGFTDQQWSTGATGSTIVVSVEGDYTVNARDSKGCEVSDVVQVRFFPVGIEELEGRSFSLFPNPNDGLFNIINRGARSQLTLEVVGINGQLVHSQVITLDANDLYPVEIDQLAKGMYTVRLITADRVEQHKMVVR